MQISGERRLAVEPLVFWNRIRDTAFLARCIPGLEQVRKIERDELQGVLRPGFAFVRGTLDLTVKIVDAVEPESVTMALQTAGIGTRSKLRATVQVSPVEDGSLVVWKVDVEELGGLLKAVPRGLIQGAALGVVEDAWRVVEKKLQEPESPPTV